MTPIGGWFPAAGFELVHTPGISRAWNQDFTDGSFLLVTDLSGYDLPDWGGPYCATWLSRRHEMREFIPLILNTKQLYQTLQRLRRTIVRDSRQAVIQFSIAKNQGSILDDSDEPLPDLASSIDSPRRRPHQRARETVD